MCIWTIDNPMKTTQSGWKIFRLWDGKLHGLHFTMVFNPNEWIKDLSQRIIKVHCAEYESGFSFYRHRQDASKYVLGMMAMRPGYYRLRHIKIRNLIATGDINGASIGIAKEIFIEE